MTAFTLRDFVVESNRIEGIKREPSNIEMEAHGAFLELRSIGIDALERFVADVAPGKPLRVRQGMNVRVGNHLPPMGGPEIASKLEYICRFALRGDTASQCYAVHQKYETLHPFMDGNGRSGRVLWLWMMGGISCAPLGFLHHWYYQSLANAPARSTPTTPAPHTMRLVVDAAFYIRGSTPA